MRKIKEHTFDHPPTGSDMTDAYNDYHYDFSHIEGVKFLLEYLEKTGQQEYYSIVKKSDQAYISSTACWIARMIDRGIEVPQHSKDFLIAKLEELKARLEKKESEMIVVHRVSVKQNIKNKAFALIDTLENMLEERKYVYFSVYDFLKEKNISEVVAQNVWDYFKAVVDELVSIKGDKEAKEAYHHLSVEDIADRITTLSALLKDVNVYMIFKSGVADIKAKEFSTSDFKYLRTYNKEDGSVILSVDPSKIVGAKIVWTLNTKYNFLNCIRGDSLSIKGSRIMGEDLSKSWAKIVKYDIVSVYLDINHGLDPDIIKNKIKNQKEYKVTLLSNENTVILNVGKG